jgi:hypothetical protein
MTASGPTRTCGHVRFCAAARKKADIGGEFETRAYWGLTIFERPFTFSVEIE